MNPVFLQKCIKNIMQCHTAMNFLKYLPRFGLSCDQSVSHNLSSTGLENTSESGARKKSTQNYFISTSLMH